MLTYANPLNNPLFPTVFWSVVAILVAGLGAILFAERRRLGTLHKSSMFVRWRTWACIAPVAVLVILAGPLPLTILVLALAGVAVYECATVTGATRVETVTLLGLGSAFVLVTAYAQTLMVPLVVASLIGVAVVSIVQKTYRRFDQAATTLLCALYVPILGAHALLIAKLPSGDGLLLALIACSGLSNVAAFAVGSLFGKHKLAPVISPNKTWEGAGGSVIGAYIGFLVMTFATPSMPLAVRLAIPLVVAVLGTLGDLFESLMKRTFGVKDAGNWLPGFGGAMDRIDGLIFILPTIYYLLMVAG